LFNMKKKKVLSLLAGVVALGFVACNNSGDSSATNDSLNKDSSGGTSASGTSTSTGNYAARADSVRTNVSAGNYLNPRTGKAYTNITVDPTTGNLTDESGAPIRRFVDKRTWWVWDVPRWDTTGMAQMKNNNLMYRSETGSWVPYDKRWTDDAMDNSNTGTENGTTGSQSGDSLKVKVSDNGNKVKVKKKD
jgi:hypothetical protein